MKIFLKNILNFTLPLIVLGVISFGLLNFLNKQRIDFKIASNVSNLYIGDSHVQSAINDSLLPNSFNLASSSEAFYYTYYKLKKLIENNPSIKKVYLSFGHNSISGYYDRFIFGDYSSVIAPKYFYVLPFSEQCRMVYWNRNNLLTFLKSIFKIREENSLKFDEESFFGGFYNKFDTSRAVVSTMDKRLDVQFYSNNELYYFSNLNIDYLDKMIDLCQTKDIELIALNTPLYPYYHKKLPTQYKEKFCELINERQLYFIDLSTLKLSENNYVPDGDHVSKTGANKTTLKLLEIINQNIKTPCIVNLTDSADFKLKPL